jgi:3-oxoacyl-[acyl-carrier protein] reductase
MDLKLENKTVLITGSAHGIGLGMITTFLEEGAQVIITDINDHILDEAVLLLRNKYNSDRILSFCGDMTKEAEIEKCAEAAINRFGSLDVLICNIGSGRSKMELSATLDDWHSVFDINLFAGVAAVQVCAPKINEDGGSIIFIASIAGIQALKAPYAYSAAKAGILSFTKNLSDDLAKRNIRVNAIAPGNVMFPGSTWDRKMKEDYSGTMKYIEENIPMKIFADPSDVGNVAAFLASSKARFITGTCIIIDGGQVRSF